MLVYWSKGCIRGFRATGTYYYGRIIITYESFHVSARHYGFFHADSDVFYQPLRANTRLVACV
jgi:hypothetical protein